MCLARNLEPEECLVTKLSYHYEEGIARARLCGQIKTIQAMAALLENYEHENYYRRSRQRNNHYEARGNNNVNNNTNNNNTYISNYNYNNNNNNQGNHNNNTNNGNSNRNNINQNNNNNRPNQAHNNNNNPLSGLLADLYLHHFENTYMFSELSLIHI